MSLANRATVSLVFEDGSDISAWTKVTIRDDYTDPLADIQLECQPPREQVLDYQTKLAKGQQVTLKINGISQGAFLIQSSPRTVSKDNGVTFSPQLHTRLCTPYEGGVDPTISLKSETDTPISTVLLEGLAAYGFDRLISDETANLTALSGKPISGGLPARPLEALKAKELQANDNESAYNFAARIFSRLGLALRVDAAGVLLLSTPDYQQAPSNDLIQDFDGSTQGDRFFGEISIEDSNEGQFSECTVRGLRPDDAAEKATATPTAQYTAIQHLPSRPTYTSTTAPFKPLLIKDKLATDATRCASVAKLALSLRARKAFSITGTVDGFISARGSVWTVNTVAMVTIAVLGISEPMWILSKTHTQDRTGGQRTQLTLLPLGALVLGDPPG